MIGMHNLLDKKEVMSYLNLREEELKAKLHSILSSCPPKKREKAKNHLFGRIREVKRMKRIVHGNEFREQCIALWRISHPHSVVVCKPHIKGEKEDARKLAEDHWVFIEKLLHPPYIINDVPHFPKDDVKYLYVEAMIHGIKHGRVDKKK